MGAESAYSGGELKVAKKNACAHRALVVARRTREAVRQARDELSRPQTMKANHLRSTHTLQGEYLTCASQ